MKNLPKFHRDTEQTALIWHGLQLIAAGSIVKQGKVYVSGESRGMFVVLKGDSLEHLDYFGDKITKRDDRESKTLGHAKQIPRVIQIHILDGIKSEPQFHSAISDKITRLQEA
jgi:hypothetical protein